jgi:hypothetical protein
LIRDPALAIIYATYRTPKLDPGSEAGMTISSDPFSTCGGITLFALKRAVAWDKLPPSQLLI